MNGNRGFTLIELMVALVLMGLVVAAVFTTLSNNNRVYTAQLASINMQQQVRASGFILPAELRELDAAEGDLVSMAPTELRIAAARQLGIVCAPPDPLGGVILIDQRRWWGVRWFDDNRDSVIIFTENDPTKRSDDGWLHAAVTGAAQNTGACTQPVGPAALLKVNVDGGNGQLIGVSPGAPLRGYEQVHLALYKDSDGFYYLGSESLVGGSWTGMQPLAGPLQENGLSFTYLDSVGNVTGNPAQVRMIDIVIRGQTDRPVGKAQMYLQDSLATRVFLRNNPRP